jgi:hypothetical protein
MVNKPYSFSKCRNRRIVGDVNKLGVNARVVVSGCQSGLIAAGDNDSSALRTSHNRDSAGNPTPLPHYDNGLTPQRFAHCLDPPFCCATSIALCCAAEEVTDELSDFQQQREVTRARR